MPAEQIHQYAAVKSGTLHTISRRCSGVWRFGQNVRNIISLWKKWNPSTSITVKILWKEAQHFNWSPCRSSSSTFQQLFPARAPWGARSELRWHTEVSAKVKQFSITQSIDIQFIEIQFIEPVSQIYTVWTRWIFMWHLEAINSLT